jgi:hypothetical protein
VADVIEPTAEAVITITSNPIVLAEVERFPAAGERSTVL